MKRFKAFRSSLAHTTGSTGSTPDAAERSMTQ
jgi:hypothetical protein